jgi:hypothetical protein
MVFICLILCEKVYFDVDHMQFNIPGREVLEITTIILDLNGTLAIDGKIIEGVKERLVERLLKA